MSIVVGRADTEHGNGESIADGTMVKGKSGGAAAERGAAGDARREGEPRGGVEGSD